MSIIHELVKDIPIPKMLKVKQTFADERLSDVEETLHQELDQEHIRNTIKPGMEIAIAVGSRGVDKIVEVTAQTVKFLDRKSTRLNSSHVAISYAVFCLKKKKKQNRKTDKRVLK